MKTFCITELFVENEFPYLVNYIRKSNLNFENVIIYLHDITTSKHLLSFHYKYNTVMLSLKK